MEATDVRMHQQARALLQHGRMGAENVTGSGSGSRAVRERLSAAVTTRQLKRAAAATRTAPLDNRTASEFGGHGTTMVAMSAPSPLLNSGSAFSGLLSMRGGAACSGSAIQEQPLDFSKKKKKLLKENDDSNDDNNDDDDADEWKSPSEGRQYLHDALISSDLKPRPAFVDDHRISPRELSKPPLDHPQFLDGRGFDNSLFVSPRTSTVLNDLMMSASVQGSQKLATVRPFKNYDSVQDYYGQKLPYASLHSRVGGLEEAEMSSMDNGYSADSYLEFRRQILNLHQSLSGSGCKRGSVVTEFIPQANVQHDRYDHHHQHHSDNNLNSGSSDNNHHQRNGHHFVERSSSDPSEVNPSRASSNSSCSSMSPVAVRHVSPVNGVGSLSTSGGAVSSIRVNHSASSTSSAEGVVGSRKRAGRSLPDELKDEAYWERRRKNNEAAKRSRDARRAKEDEIAIRAAFLEQENLKLRVEVTSLKSETAKLRCLLYNS